MKVHASSHGVARGPGHACEDAWRVQQYEGRVIAALADGMGSARLGGEAARRAVEMITDYLVGRPQGWSPRRALIEFAGRINRALYMESQVQHGAPELMCTLSVVALEGGTLYGLNVGDSPVFIRRKGGLIQLSEDHTVEDEGMEHVLTRAVGATAVLEPHTFETPIEAGDVILLCSDGVSRTVGERSLDELLSRHVIARTIVASAQDVVRDNPELADDASAVILDVIEQGWAPGNVNRALEVCGPLHEGDRIDDLTLARALGPSRRVWEARRPDGTPVAVKFPPLEAIDDEVRRDAFEREAWQASMVASDDLVPATIPVTGTLRYYEMEYIEAPTLSQVLKQGPLKVEDAITLATFLLRCGQTLLEHDIVHGDIKPDNVLVLRGAGDAGLRFRLLDLGSAAEVFSVTSRAGTPSFLAPERFRGAAAAERTEVFAIGVTLYQALTGAYPYGEIERFQTPRFDHPPKPPSRLKATIPDWLEAVVLRALSVDPGRRYQAFSEMAYDLAHPDQVDPFYRKDAPLLERNPLLFYKLLCVLLSGVVGLLLWRLTVK